MREIALEANPSTWSDGLRNDNLTTTNRSTPGIRIGQAGFANDVSVHPMFFRDEPHEPDQAADQGHEAQREHEIAVSPIDCM